MVFMFLFTCVVCKSVGLAIPVLGCGEEGCNRDSDAFLAPSVGFGKRPARQHERLP